MIDARAVIDAGARIGSNVEIGPYSIIGPDVEIGDDCWIGPHVVINGPTSIGRENKIFQFASVGEAPQDKKYAGETTRLEIGDRNTIREFVTINRGTIQDEGVTKIGDDNWIMAYVHIAHDCVLGNRIVLANNASLAGHVLVGDDAILGGFALVHQFCRIGAQSLLAFASGIKQDVPPYVIVSGSEAAPHGINKVGLQRRNVSAAEITAIRRAYKVIYKSDLRLEQAVEKISLMADEYPSLAILSEFLATSKRGIVR